MKIGAERAISNLNNRKPLGLRVLRCPTTHEIFRVIRLATELKDCGSFSTVSLQNLVERTGYKKSEIMELMNKYDDIFLAIPSSGGYKLRSQIGAEQYIEKMGISLIKQRTFFMMLSMALPALVLFTILFGIILTL